MNPKSLLSESIAVQNIFKFIIFKNLMHIVNSTASCIHTLSNDKPMRLKIRHSQLKTLILVNINIVLWGEKHAFQLSCCRAGQGTLSVEDHQLGSVLKQRSRSKRGQVNAKHQATIMSIAAKHVPVYRFPLRCKMPLGY